jgi:hypothetical protein
MLPVFELREIINVGYQEIRNAIKIMRWHFPDFLTLKDHKHKSIEYYLIVISLVLSPLVRVALLSQSPFP